MLLPVFSLPKCVTKTPPLIFEFHVVSHACLRPVSGLSHKMVRQATPLSSLVTAIVRLIFVVFCANCFVCLDKYLIKVNKHFSGFASKNMCKTDLDHSSLRLSSLCGKYFFTFGSWRTRVSAVRAARVMYFQAQENTNLKALKDM